MNPVIHLISGPRNISTALMYSFSQLPDFRVLDEPFYGYYLRHAEVGIQHPMEADIMATMKTELDDVLEEINGLATNNPVFLKSMAHHYFEPDPQFMLDWQNLLLIRHPEKLLASFSKVIPNPTLADIGIRKAAALYQFLKDHGKTPLVIDSDELMKDPGPYLKLVSEAMRIPFSESMLQWPKGGNKADGIWAPYWYKNVHASTGFEKRQAQENKMPDALLPILEEALPYYNQLHESILKNN